MDPEPKWDFLEILNTNIEDLEITKAVRRLGSRPILDLKLKTPVPALNKLANLKITDWDFSEAPKPKKEAEKEPAGAELSQQEMQELIDQLKRFLQYVTVNLIDQPKHAQIKIQLLTPTTLQFRLVLVKKDSAMLIGHGGNTAAAIRNLIKARAATKGLNALLVIHSHEEEMALNYQKLAESPVFRAGMNNDKS